MNTQHSATRFPKSLLAALSLLFFMCMAVAQAQTTATKSLTTSATGTFTDAAGGVGKFVGTFTIQKFAQQNGGLVAIGTLSGTMTDSTGTVLGNVVKTASLPVTSIDGSCEILHLELGPLDLDLLGLQVHLDKIVLDITAQSGAGNLLGNLLCAIAGLLDGGGPLSQIVSLLNQILAILGA